MIESKDPPDPGGADGDDPLLVSATGRWVVPTRVREFRTDSRGGWHSPEELAHALGLRRADLIQRVWAAVTRAADGRKGSAVTVPSPVGRPGSLITVRPAREQGFAVVALQRVDTSPPPPVTLLYELFHYTPTEAAIALALLRGEELSDIATSRGISLETVRGHVKSVLRKSGTSSQKQLTAMLSRLGSLAIGLASDAPG